MRINESQEITEQRVPRQMASKINKVYLLHFWIDKFLQPRETDPRPTL